MRKLADVGPAPLRRALIVNIHLDVRFWVETLGLTQPEIDEIKTRVPLPHDLSKNAGIDFDKWFYGTISVHIQEWRGGYRHIEVDFLSPTEKRKPIDLYLGRSRAELWCFMLPERTDFQGGNLRLESDGQCITLSATAGRFGFLNMVDTEPALHNVFLTVPTEEGPQAEPYFKPNRRIEFYPDVYRYLQPWERCYEHLDSQKGLAWELWITDCDLHTRSGGNAPEARRRLLAEWRERFTWNDTGKEWYERVAKAVEDVPQKERANLQQRFGVESAEDDEPAPQPDTTEEA